jgi:hypothetical protein
MAAICPCACVFLPSLRAVWPRQACAPFRHSLYSFPWVVVVVVMFFFFFLAFLEVTTVHSFSSCLTGGAIVVLTEDVIIGSLLPAFLEGELVFYPLSWSRMSLAIWGPSSSILFSRASILRSLSLDLRSRSLRPEHSASCLRRRCRAPVRSFSCRTRASKRR